MKNCIERQCSQMFNILMFIIVVPYKKYTCKKWFTCGIGTITCDSHMIHIWFTCDSHVKHMCIFHKGCAADCMCAMFLFPIYCSDKQVRATMLFWRLRKSEDRSSRIELCWHWVKFGWDECWNRMQFKWK
jgi:hypothetical protein